MTLTRILEGPISVFPSGYRARTAISGKLFVAKLPRTETSILACARGGSLSAPVRSDLRTSKRLEIYIWYYMMLYAQID